MSITITIAMSAALSLGLKPSQPSTELQYFDFKVIRICERLVAISAKTFFSLPALPGLEKWPDTESTSLGYLLHPEYHKIYHMQIFHAHL